MRKVLLTAFYRWEAEVQCSYVICLESHSDYMAPIGQAYTAGQQTRGYWLECKDFVSLFSLCFVFVFLFL